MVEAYGTGYGAWLMHDFTQFFCMVDARFGIGVGAWLINLLWYRLWYTGDAWYGT